MNNNKIAKKEVRIAKKANIKSPYVGSESIKKVFNSNTQDVYIASGWFNENQAKDLNNIKIMLNELRISYFSPKDVFEVKPNDTKDIQKEVFNNNIKAIKKAKFIIANTRDKDLGTIFECGVAYSNKIPIIYFCDGLVGSFNLMLGSSGIAVATSIDELKKHTNNFVKDNTYKCSYQGSIE